MSDPTHKSTTSASTAGARARNELEEIVRDTKDVADKAVERAKAKAVDYYERGRERAEEYQDWFVDYVRDNPIKTVLIAVGAGALLGALWRR